MPGMSRKAYARLMLFTDRKRYVRKLRGQPARKLGDHRVFRVKMIGVDEAQPQLRRALELVVLDIGGHIGVTACRGSLLETPGARAAHDRKP